MSGLLNERFENVVHGVAWNTTQYTATNETTDIDNAKVNVPAKPGPNLTYRIMMAGTKTGANAAMSVALKLGSTAVMTIAADDGTAVDWVAEFLITFINAKSQKVLGRFLADTADPGVDYAAGTVDCSAGAQLVPQIISAHGSDTVACEMATVEKGGYL